MTDLQHEEPPYRLECAVAQLDGPRQRRQIGEEQVGVRADGVELDDPDAAVERRAATLDTDALTLTGLARGACRARPVRQGVGYPDIRVEHVALYGDGRVVSGDNVRTTAAWIVPVEGAPTEVDLDLVMVAVEWQAVGAVEARWRLVAEPRSLGQEEAV
eukprot:scaffold2264_cov114-Isochrysis_galbana.AAC.13